LMHERVKSHARAAVQTAVCTQAKRYAGGAQGGVRTVTACEITAV